MLAGIGENPKVFFLLITFSSDQVEPILEEVVGVSSFPAALGAGWGIYGFGIDVPPFGAARGCHAFVIRWISVSVDVSVSCECEYLGTWIPGYFRV